MKVEDADHCFFKALREGDAPALEGLLTEDFVLVDVMRGAEVSRADLVGAVGGGQLRFDAIDLVASRVRRYGDTAVVTGQTEMRGRMGEASWLARSRYTHVYVEQDHRWRLASAQGTPIVGD